MRKIKRVALIRSRVTKSEVDQAIEGHIKALQARLKELLGGTHIIRLKLPEENNGCLVVCINKAEISFDKKDDDPEAFLHNIDHDFAGDIEEFDYWGMTYASVASAIAYMFGMYLNPSRTVIKEGRKEHVLTF